MTRQVLEVEQPTRSPIKPYKASVMLNSINSASALLPAAGVRSQVSRMDLEGADLATSGSAFKANNEALGRPRYLVPGTNQGVYMHASALVSATITQFWVDFTCNRVGAAESGCLFACRVMTRTWHHSPLSTHVESRYRSQRSIRYRRGEPF
jgi:hypothetical protein